MAIEQVAERLAGYVEAVRKAVDAHTMGIDNFALQPVTGVNRQRGMQG